MRADSSEKLANPKVAIYVRKRSPLSMIYCCYTYHAYNIDVGVVGVNNLSIIMPFAFFGDKTYTKN